MEIIGKRLEEARKEMGYSQKTVAELLGVAPSTYNLYEKGKRTLSAEKAFRLREILHISFDEMAGRDDGVKWENCFHESTPYYHVKGQDTCEDYYNYQGPGRVELLYGMLIEMCVPGRKHQRIVAEMSYRLQSHVKKNKGKCEVYPGGLSVKLSEEKRLILVPDIVVICDPDQLDDRGCNGAPDMVVEVLSSSTARYDLIDKLGTYRESGVREYWIVDIKKERVMVYDFTKEDIIQIYGFDDEIPVGIFPGLQIIMREML